MAPIQRTFTTIPDIPPLRQGAAPSIKPPMTSKQAQKLYRQANRVPRLSKAEERRLEKQRQDEIKKEFERDRAQAKSRTLREKKRAREDEVREAKRKKGLPIVSCRPSQAMISTFLRGNEVSKEVEIEKTVIQSENPSDMESSERPRLKRHSSLDMGSAEQILKAPALTQPQNNSELSQKPRQVEGPNQPSPKQAPPSTQAFVLEHVDDMFLSASQLARELEDEYQTSICGQFVVNRVPLFCLQDLELSSQDLRELESPGPAKPEPVECSPPTGRFFTSSGNNERLALGILRSRRAASRDELTRRDTQRRARDPQLSVSELVRQDPNQDMSVFLDELSTINWDDDSDDF